MCQGIADGESLLHTGFQDPEYESTGRRMAVFRGPGCSKRSQGLSCGCHHEWVTTLLGHHPSAPGHSWAPC